MSAKLMGQVWELELSPNHQIMMLALADHANDDGSSVHPGVPYLAWKTGYSERNVTRILRELKDAGLICPVAYEQGGGRNATCYEMDLSKGDKKSPLKRYQGRHNGTANRGAKLSNSEVRGDKSDTSGVTNPVVRGDKSDTPHIEYPPVEPSRNITRTISTEMSPDGDDSPPHIATDSLFASAEDAVKPKSPSRSQCDSDSCKVTTRDIQEAYQEACGYPVVWSNGNAKAAKWLAQNGYTGAQVRGCYEDMKRLEFWADKPLHLASVQKTIGEWAKQGGFKTNGKPNHETRADQRAREERELEERALAELAARGYRGIGAQNGTAAHGAAQLPGRVPRSAQR